MDILSSLGCWCLHGLCESCKSPLGHGYGVRGANVDLAGRILFNVLYCAKVNRDKRNGKYDKYAGYNDDRNPDFKMIL